jgi:hypothetical protein
MLDTMRPTVSSACIVATLVLPHVAEPADPLPWNIPERLRVAIELPAFKTAFDVGGWLNPFYLRGDFDGDGSPDYAVLAVHRSDGKKGIAIWLSSKSSSQPRMIGAGTKSRAGGGVSDNWDFFDGWQVYGKRTVSQGVGEGRKPPRLIGEAILIEKSESASGLLYWDGNQFRWYQQGD